MRVVVLYHMFFYPSPRVVEARRRSASSSAYPQRDKPYALTLELAMAGASRSRLGARLGACDSNDRPRSPGDARARDRRRASEKSSR